MKKAIRYSLFLILNLYFSEGFALNNVLDQIEVQNSRDQSTIKILFTQRLIYRSHAPEHDGDLIHVTLNFQGTTNAIMSESESLTWKPSRNVPLFQVSLDPANQVRADLVLRFNKNVHFDVQGSSDGYSITVTIYHPETQQQTAPEAILNDEVPPLPSFQKNAENEVIAKLMEEARQAMAKQDYESAIRLYTKVLGQNQTVFAKQALEYLGVAREKNKQLAHAKKLYEQYLKRYPKGADAERVKQRLIAMISASAPPKQKLRTIAKQKKQAPEIEVYGGVSESYNKNIFISDTTGRTVTLDNLRSDLDVTAKLRGQNYDLMSRVSGGLTSDFLSSGASDETRLSSFYFDARDRVRGASLRVGRQSRTSGGVLGRFDGAYGGYQINERFKLNLVAGYPVDSSRVVSLKTERRFYGVSVDIGTINNAWDFNVFAINQQNNGLTDRRAIGGEARYFDPKKSFFSLIDYDVFYGALNMFIFNGRWSPTHNTSFNLNYDYRKSPILTTRNALTGQTVTHLQELLQIYPQKTIYQLAQDRTADSHMLFSGVSYQLSEHYQINADLRLSKFSSTPASAGVIGFDGTALEKEYSMQLTGTSLIKEGDLLLFTSTYSDLTTSNVITLILNTRYPITRKLRINPKLKFRKRDIHTSNSEQYIYTPAMQMTYRVTRKFQIEAEVDADFVTTKSANLTEHYQNYFFLAGFRYDF